MTVEISGKTYRLVVQIRDHVGDKWRTIECTPAQVREVAARCGELFNKMQPDGGRPKNVSFTFDIVPAGIFGKGCKVQLHAVTADETTHEVSSYSKTDQAALHDLSNTLLPHYIAFHNATSKKPVLHKDGVAPPAPVVNSADSSDSDDGYVIVE
jgi:hypothetical protein